MKPPSIQLPDSGVHPVSAAPHELRSAVEKRGMAWQEVDLSGVHDKHTLMAAFVRGLRLPADFGANWDALADALHDLVEAGEACLFLGNARACATRSPDEFSMLCSVLADVAAEWRTRKRRFLALLSGVQPG